MDRFRMLPNYHYYNNADGVITTRYEKPLRDYRIYGNSIQDGTPSPDNPIEIQSVGEKTTNLFDINSITKMVNSGGGSLNNYFKNEDGILQNNMADYGSSTGYVVSMQLEKGLYCLSMDVRFVSKPGDVSIFYNFDDSTRQWFSSISLEWSRIFYTFELTEDTEITTWNFIPNGNKDNYLNRQAQFTNIMLSKISNTDEHPKYEPFGKYKIPIEVSNENGGTQTYNIYLDEPLRKVGDYADYIDFRSGKVVRLMGSRVFNGTEVWYVHGSTNEGKVFRNENLLTPLIGAPIQATCMSHFELTQRYETAMFKKGQYRFSYNTQNYTILNSKIYVSAEQTTVQDFQIWLSENKPVLLYPLATPTEEVIDLPKIQLNKGTNNIIIKTTTQPSQVNWQYYK